MELKDAIKLIRKELVIKDEPLKAWKLLQLIKEVPGLEEERKNTYGMVRHVYEPKWFNKLYDIPAENCEQIEPIEIAQNPGLRFSRYQWVVDSIKKQEAKSVIDLGCYVGSLPIYFAKQGLRAIGVDLTTNTLKVAKERNIKLRTNAKFYLEDVTKFKPKKKVDAVTCLELFEHVIVDPQEFIDHMISMVKPGGFVYVSTPDGPFEDGKGNIEGGWEWDGKLGRGHIRVFVRETIMPLLKKYKLGELFSQDGLLCFSYRRKNESPKD
jgi:2-polyprenyl-3-methyl-5-hydroxy-6-metoxy-1,4-benzoquinol methylase